jgi:hypothetical protein
LEIPGVSIAPPWQVTRSEKRGASASRIAVARATATSRASTVCEPIVPPEELPKWTMMLSTPASAMASASSIEVQNALVNRPRRDALASASTSRAKPMPVSSSAARNVPSMSATVGQFMTPSKPHAAISFRNRRMSRVGSTHRSPAMIGHSATTLRRLRAPSSMVSALASQIGR